MTANHLIIMVSALPSIGNLICAAVVVGAICLAFAVCEDLTRVRDISEAADELIGSDMPLADRYADFWKINRVCAESRRKSIFFKKRYDGVMLKLRAAEL